MLEIISSSLSIACQDGGPEVNKEIKEMNLEDLEIILRKRESSTVSQSLSILCGLILSFSGALGINF